ncbi:Bug family tripartite tricarboxylate transporter substrate binding protein [Bordetella hinzii]|uniref:Tripartite tricarboxylate transporter substrate binding protein n=2 Tax=Bordetella hinzii TaxID=103855 RepID=A0AAN1RTE1_9BORD|nr:tripartite tricarboxylate transporter substrate binding protein [Bordetella hinzii]AKQ54555.1 Tripartite tricarboxylate transporter family receptor [Bordetella hinzii]AKQ59068.1 Tripartite tricarboxylate transporter family receptor [Bordetella hinzii]AZW15664.1 tripartite tricarboxylate transporter substrate binding protein [Bordetella hinzii]KCB26524.1 tripartite tricarboxylate transporter family receptor [Bordetella hinzii OH87 BAL007II]KCB31363.1 tripartite tricarboxylate transporter fam
MTMAKKPRLARALTGLIAGAVSAFALSTAPAQAAYPDKPVRIVVGFSAGGTTDVIARIMAKELTESLGQSFVVENKPGGGSNIATDYVARATPDGYTLLFVAVTSAINQTLYTNVNFDLVKDFAPVALGAKVPNILVINPQVPVKSVQELVAYAKAHPGKLAFASSGSGTSIHMAGELFKQRAGIDVLHVPYKGSAPAVTDLIGGQVQFMFDNMPSSWPHVQSGKLRALAVTTTERSKSAPDLPTMQESGFDKFDVSSWFGLIAPAGTPPDVIEKLNAAMNKALDKASVQKSYESLGAVGQKTTPAEFGAFIKSEVEGWAPVVKASGAKVD